MNKAGGVRFSVAGGEQEGALKARSEGKISGLVPWWEKVRR